MHTKMHDPVDSLIYLDRALPLGWLEEQLTEYFADEDGEVLADSIEADFIATVTTTIARIRDEAQLHDDGRRVYSTGVPFERVEQYPSTEPDPETGVDVPVITESHVQLHPDGTPTEPLNGGVWKDEVTS